MLSIYKVDIASKWSTCDLPVIQTISMHIMGQYRCDLQWFKMIQNIDCTQIVSGLQANYTIY